MLPDGSLPAGGAERATAREVMHAITHFAAQAAFEIRFDTAATGLRVDGGGLEIMTSAGPVRARRLVVATGEYQNPFRLPLPGTFDGRVQHSSEVHARDVDPAESVVVVGAGNSGAELAVALSRQGNTVAVATSRPVQRPRAEPAGMAGTVFWWLSGVPISRLPKRGGCVPRTPLVDPDLFEAVQAGRVRVIGPAERLAGRHLMTTHRESVECDRVVLATGFVRETAWLGSLITRDALGVPRHVSGVSPEVSGLGFVGIPCMRTRRSGFLRGLVGDAQRVVGKLA